MLQQVLAYLDHPGIWISFLTLSLLEIVLGIDNVIFVAVVANRLAAPARSAARTVGIILAFFMRVAFLATIVWLVALRSSLFSVGGFDVTWRDIILAGGGLFLLYKSVVEIAAELRGEAVHERAATASSFGIVVIQIVLLDLVFSVDSIFTAVGLSRQLPVMIAAIVVAMLVMLLASGPVGNFIHHHPALKMLALTFLLFVSAGLLADAAHLHLDHTYLFMSIGFALAAELLLFCAPQGARAALTVPVLLVCAAALTACVYAMRMTRPELSWSYAYVPAAFGTFVQILNFIAFATQKRLARESAKVKEPA